MRRAWNRLALLLQAWLLYGSWPAFAELMGWTALGSLFLASVAVAVEAVWTMW